MTTTASDLTTAEATNLHEQLRAEETLYRARIGVATDSGERAALFAHLASLLERQISNRPAMGGRAREIDQFVNWARSEATDADAAARIEHAREVAHRKGAALPEITALTRGQATPQQWVALYEAAARGAGS